MISKEEEGELSSKIINRFWSPNVNVMNKVKENCNSNNFNNILDVGPGKIPFELANYVIDVDETYVNLYGTKNFLKLNINYEKFPYENNFFDFCNSRHTLEDISTPFFAFNEITRVSKQGYIETPSPLIEIMKGVDCGNTLHRGYWHHRYIVWSNKETNTLYFLPKMPLIEYIIFDKEMMKKLHFTANTVPILWNNYYIWNENMPPNIIVYGYNSDYNFIDNYSNLINDAINKSIEYTNSFFGDCFI